MEHNKTSIIYGVLDLLMAAFYVFLFVWVIPSRSTLITVTIVGLSLLFGLGGAGMLWNNRWGKLLATLTSLVMLAACLLFICLVASSMAYLHGIYDGIGQAGVAIGAIAILLSFEVLGLLPALQLAHLRRVARQVKA